MQKTHPAHLESFLLKAADIRRGRWGGATRFDKRRATP